MANSYKILKEDFVSNLAGGDITEINYVTAVAPVCASVLCSLRLLTCRDLRRPVVNIANTAILFPSVHAFGVCRRLPAQCRRYPACHDLVCQSTCIAQPTSLGSHSSALCSTTPDHDSAIETCVESCKGLCRRGFFAHQAIPDHLPRIHARNHLPGNTCC